MCPCFSKYYNTGSEYTYRITHCLYNLCIIYTYICTRNHLIKVSIALNVRALVWANLNNAISYLFIGARLSVRVPDMTLLVHFKQIFQHIFHVFWRTKQIFYSDGKMKIFGSKNSTFLFFLNNFLFFITLIFYSAGLTFV